jgi:hypothetical protein
MKSALLNLTVLIGILVLCAGVMAVESSSASASPAKDTAIIDQTVMQPPKESRLLAMGVGPDPTPCPSGYFRVGGTIRTCTAYGDGSCPGLPVFDPNVGLTCCPGPQGTEFGWGQLPSDVCYKVWAVGTFDGFLGGGGEDAECGRNLSCPCTKAIQCKIFVETWPYSHYRCTGLSGNDPIVWQYAACGELFDQ